MRAGAPGKEHTGAWHWQAALTETLQYKATGWLEVSVCLWAAAIASTEFIVCRERQREKTDHEAACWDEIW